MALLAFLLAAGAAQSTGVAQDLHVTAWNSSTSTAVIRYGTRENGETWFTCNGSSSSECIFLLFQEPCDAHVSAGKATHGANCTAKEIGAFALKLGQSRVEKALPPDFQVCASSKAPPVAPACKRQAQIIRPVQAVRGS